MHVKEQGDVEEGLGLVPVMYFRHFASVYIDFTPPRSRLQRSLYPARLTQELSGSCGGSPLRPSVPHQVNSEKLGHAYRWEMGRFSAQH